jgi:hypothetical protein
MSCEPAYYARTGTLRGDVLALLHPPYTAWHLSYVLLGAGLAPELSWTILILVLVAFFGGTGIAAHALDELNGRPLSTGFTDSQLKKITLAGFCLAFVSALIGAAIISWWVLPLALVGGLLVAAYSLEWWGGMVHTNLGFGLAWGGFPVLVGYWAQTESVSLAAILAAAAATWLSLAQRGLSTPARFVRRKTDNARLEFDHSDSTQNWDRARLLESWEKPLKALSFSSLALGLALVLRHL